MREIKFRAVFKDGSIEYFDMDEIINKIGLAFSREGIKTVEQYTGLKDRNGKEIYEGDIVYSKRSSNKGYVFWHDGRAMFCVDCSETDKYIEPNDDWFDYEIIGNIHESALENNSKEKEGG